MVEYIVFFPLYPLNANRKQTALIKTKPLANIVLIKG